MGLDHDDRIPCCAMNDANAVHHGSPSISVVKT
jgi:hypothetical protein